jgi:hypothetical protein
MDLNDPESYRVMVLLLYALQKPESRQSCGVQQQSLMVLDMPLPQLPIILLQPHSWPLTLSFRRLMVVANTNSTSASAVPATSAPGGAEATTVSGKLPVPQGATRGGSGKGGARQQ